MWYRTAALSFMVTEFVNSSAKAAKQKLMNQKIQKRF
jgi:hypothetical protein